MVVSCEVIDGSTGFRQSKTLRHARPDDVSCCGVVSESYGAHLTMVSEN
jgi:hypothetical protein